MALFKFFIIMALDMPSELFCEHSLVSCIEVSLWCITDIKIKGIVCERGQS